MEESAAERAVAAARDIKVIPMAVVPKVVSPAARRQEAPAVRKCDNQKARILRRTRGLPTMRCENRFTKNRWR